MPRIHRTFHPHRIQFITSSTYRRTPLFRRVEFCREFVRTLDRVRAELGFLLLGWVLMADHFHLLVKPEPAEHTSLIVQQLKQRTAYRILRTLRENRQSRWCQQMVVRLRLPLTVHDKATHRVWQRRFYVFEVYSEEKRPEKLDYMHANPVHQGLVPSPEQWLRRPSRRYEPVARGSAPSTLPF